MFKKEHGLLQNEKSKKIYIKTTNKIYIQKNTVLKNKIQITLGKSFNTILSSGVWGTYKLVWMVL